jgi:hypothetical protein
MQIKQTATAVTEAATVEPLTVTVKQAADLTGLCVRSSWGALADGRLETAKVEGMRRRLVTYPSLKRMVAAK